MDWIKHWTIGVIFTATTLQMKPNVNYLISFLIIYM